MFYLVIRLRSNLSRITNQSKNNQLLFYFLKMKSKTFNTSSFEVSQREKQDGFLKKGRFYKTVRLIRRPTKTKVI